MIQYPPLIANTIPAFGNEEVIIPFTQNPAVSINEIWGFVLIIKEYGTTEPIGVLEQSIWTNSSRTELNINVINYNREARNGEIKFNIKGYNLQQKYYKFQIAYKETTIIEDYTYSTVSVGRCLGGKLPEFLIEGLSENKLNLNPVIYNGIFKTEIVSEPLYSYRFIVKDKETIIQDSGEIVHDIDTDTFETINNTNIRTSYFNFKLRYEIPQEKVYDVNCVITTVNGYTQSFTYPVITATQLAPLFTGKLLVEQDIKAKENGYVSIRIDRTNAKTYGGYFILERSSDQREWNILTSFKISENVDLENFEWKDRSVEQGVTYYYGIRECTQNQSQYSDRINAENAITVEFEDMFLGDEKRQLKIKFNPKISSFKNTILEQKTDTIGGKYPFFFRNNQIKYKEIPISGLISYWMDEENLFSEQDFNNSINLTNNNFFNERQFKIEVLEWLTDGNPKLFRSPAEGNYVVRLMNTSLTPQDQLGRMLHSFSSTGYETMDNNIENLLQNGLIKFLDPGNLRKRQKIILDLTWYNGTGGRFVGNKINNIKWETNRLGVDTIKIDGKSYKNMGGIFSTEGLSEYYNIIEIPRNVAAEGGFSLEYELSEDTYMNSFTEMIENTNDVIFSIPAGTSVSNVLGNVSGGSNSITVYYTYVLRVQVIDSTKSCKLTINNVEYDYNDLSSASPPEYFYNLDGNTYYEKNEGLQLDIYARISSNANSSSMFKQYIINS